MSNGDMQPPAEQGDLPVGTRSGNWFWDGQRWACDWDRDRDRPPWPCLPPGQPPWYGPDRPPWYPGANAGVSFGNEAPRFPIRGHFWWNGTHLQMFDGAAWVHIGPGAAPVTPTVQA